MKVIRVKLSWLVYFFCFIGCSIQIYHITCIYLEFKVRHEVTHDYTDQVELPTIDIIIPMVMTINLTELFIRYPKKMTDLCQLGSFDTVNVTIDNFNSQCLHGLKKPGRLMSYTITKFIKVKDINELTIDPRDQIDFIQIGNANFTTDQCNMKRYYNGLAVFLRISCTEQAALITENLNIISTYGRNIATIGHSFGSNFGIRFASQLDMPVYELSKYFMVTSESNKMTFTWVRYEKMVYRSLPYPYETNCRFYDKLKPLYDCVFNYSLHKRGLMRSFINEWDSQPEYVEFETNTVNLNRMRWDCSRWKLVPECNKITYLTNGEIRLEQVDANLSGLIFIQQPVTPIMYFNVHPELLLSEYFIFVGSIIGTWFGYSIFDRLISMLTWIKSKVTNTKIRKSRGRESPIKIFTIRNSYNFSHPLLHSTPHSSRFASSYSSIDTIKTIHVYRDFF